MPITPTNQSKNTVTPVGARKAGVYLWGDVEATWGDSLATWGDLSLVPVNQTKHSSGTSISQGQPMGLLLAITYPTSFSLSGGVVNQSKS